MSKFNKGKKEKKSKKTSLSIIQRRIIASVLASSLIIGGIGAYVVFDKTSKANALDKVLETVSEKRSQVLSKDSFISQEKEAEENKDEQIRVIVNLKADAAIDKINNQDELENTSKMIAYEEKVLANQDSVINKVEEITGTKVENQSGYLVNSFAIDATKEQVNEICKIKEVEEVTEAISYTFEDNNKALSYTVDDYKEISDKIYEETGIKTLHNKDGKNYSGVSTVVAIIDSGVNYKHNDMKLDEGVTPKYTKEEWQKKISALGYGTYFSEKVPFGYNYIGDDNEIMDDRAGHGYHVSGIAGGNGAILGVAPNTQILALKSLGTLGGTSDQVVKAIEDAVKLGADVINMSLGSPCGITQEDDIELEAIRKATESGVLCCIAAGNESTIDGMNTESNNFRLKDTASVSAPGIASEGLTVASANIKVSGDNRTIYMASTSSWGPTNELKIKPEITAPGQNILATYTGIDGYETLSGTSMASPFIAGCSALLVNEVKNNSILSLKDNNVLEGKELAEFIKNNLMNTSKVIYDGMYQPLSNNVPCSIRVQGAGLVNAEAAINNRVIATCNDVAKVELGEINGTEEITIKLTNYGDTDVTYNIEGTKMYEPKDETLCYYMKESSSGKINASGTVTVPRRGETIVKASVSASADQGKFIEGFIRFVSEQAPTLSLPVLGFIGDWSEEPIIDQSVYESGESYIKKNKVKHFETKEELESQTCLIATNRNYDHIVLGMNGTKEDKNVTYNSDLCAFSPNNDRVMDEVRVGITQLRNIYEIQFVVLDKDGNKIRVCGTTQGIRRMNFYDFCKNVMKHLDVTSQSDYKNVMSWDGKVYDKATDEYVPAKEGQYFIQIQTKVAKDEDVQKITMPLKLDKTKPELSKSIIQKVGNDYNYSFSVNDNTGMESYVYVYIDGEVTEYAYNDLKKNNSNEYLLEIKDAADKECYVVFSDVAGNQVVQNLSEIQEDKIKNKDEYEETKSDEEGFKVTVIEDNPSIKSYFTKVESTTQYLLLNLDDNATTLEFDVKCNEKYKITKGKISANRIGGYNGMTEEEMYMNGYSPKKQINGTLNSDGSIHFKMDNDVDWKFVDYTFTSDDGSRYSGCFQIYRLSQEDEFTENIIYEDVNNLFSDIAYQFIEDKDINEAGEYEYNGKIISRPKTFTINNTPISVNDKGEFVYKLKVKKGMNKIDIRMGTEYNEAEQSVEFYYNTMEVKLDMEEIDGKIKSSTQEFSIKGNITSYITGYTIWLNGDNMYTETENKVLDGSKQNANVKNFDYHVKLKEGDNEFTLKVTNHRNQTVVKKFVINYTP